MPRALARGKMEAHKNLKLDSDFFTRMLSKKASGPEEYRDFDVYLMEKSVMPLLLQGLDALSRHVDKSDPGQGINGRQFNPLVWLAQYMLRNHPRHVKDHRTPMYEKFTELASIERGRRCLIRKREQIQDSWNELLQEKNLASEGQHSVSLEIDDIADVFERLDEAWYLEGALLEKLPKDWSKVEIVTSESGEVCFADFFEWFEVYVQSNDILRATAFSDAERRQAEMEMQALREKEDAARRARAMKEALEQRSELEEHFETVTADMYINGDVARIMNKGAIIDGVEEKEGGPPLQGEHIVLIRLMLGIWGCPVTDDTDGDIWNDVTLAAWQSWLKARGIEASRGVDKNTIRRLLDKDEFEEYLQRTFPVKDDDADDDYVKQIVEVRGFVEDEVDIMVEAVDEDTGELLHLTLPEHEVEELKVRLAEATSQMPVLAMADRVSGRIVTVMPSGQAGA